MADVVTWNLDELRRRFERSYQIAQPAAEVGPGTQPGLDARVAADMQLVFHADVQAVGDTSLLRTRRGSQLDEVGEMEGVPRPPATGASGYVLARTAVGGATIFAGDFLTPKNSNMRYQCTTTALYANGAQVPVLGFDTGPDTNLDAGTELEWSNPRPGCLPSTTVWSEGLTGGREEASDEEYIELIIDQRRNPPASGNDAAYQAFVQNPTNHGVAVQKAFTYPAIVGPGTTAIAFLLRPSTPGGSRVPSTAQIALVDAALRGSFPGDDGIFVLQVAEQATAVALGVTWKTAAAPFVDAAPWPTWIPGSPVAVDGAVAISASAMRVTTSTTTDAPLVGQTIGVYNAAKARFARKQIASVVTVIAGKSWDLTFDLTGNASDGAFVPAAGALVSPWSDSLDSVVPALTSFFDAMGPGELVAIFYDEGRRQKRQPENPESWPSEVGRQLESRVDALDTVRSTTLLAPTLGATSIGLPTSLAYLRQLTDLAIYVEA